MRIGIIFYGEQAKSRGLHQLARCLRKLGHKPFIVTRRMSTSEEILEHSGTQIIRVPAIANCLTNVITFPLPFNINWRRWIVKLAQQYKWQALFVRETPLSWQALAAGKKLGIPVFLDMRENLAAMYQAGSAKSAMFSIVKQPAFVRFYEKITMGQYDHIFPSTPELGDWASLAYNINQDKITVIENTPHDEFLLAAEKALKNAPAKSDLIRLVYAGHIKERKGIGDIIASMPYVISKCPRVRLRVIGDGPDLGRMKTLARELNIGDNVEFLPMLSEAELISSLSECCIGLESSWLNELTHQTVPGKLYEYMALGLPVLSCARKPVERIIRECNCGKIYRSREPEKIAESILDMIADRSQLQEMGECSRSAILQRYNWQSNINKLSSVLKAYQNES